MKVDGATKEPTLAFHHGSDGSQNLTGVRLILQYGQPRSASTFQFTLLCAAALLRYAGDRPVACSNHSSMNLQAALQGGLSVVKTHSLHVIDSVPAQLRARMAVFVTQGRFEHSILNTAPNEYALEVRRRGMHLVHVQEYESFRWHGPAFTVLSYAPIFGLGPRHSEMLAHFMRFWAILRQCCGLQRSSDYRSSIALPATRLARVHAEHDLDHPHCEVYDLNAVEKALLSTQIAHRWSAVVLGLLADGSAKDVDGHFCARSDMELRARARTAQGATQLALSHKLYADAYMRRES